jgi:hypothetical protein
MIDFLHRLFIGHTHNWVEVKTIRCGVDETGVPDAYIYVLQCSICGDMKNHKVG